MYYAKKTKFNISILKSNQLLYLPCKMWIFSSQYKGLTWIIVACFDSSRGLSIRASEDCCRASWPSPWRRGPRRRRPLGWWGSRRRRWRRSIWMPWCRCHIPCSCHIDITSRHVLSPALGHDGRDDEVYEEDHRAENSDRGRDKVLPLLPHPVTGWQGWTERCQWSLQ